MNLDNAKKLMKDRDWYGGLGRPLEDPKVQNTHLALSDEVPGLVQEIERLDENNDKIKSVLLKIANARNTCYSTGEALSKAMYWARDAIGLTEDQIRWTRMDRVTITGADDSTDPNDLATLSAEFPFVEWGILFGSHPGTPRFPGSNFRHRLARAKELNPKMKLSAHLCGRFVRDLVELGQLSFRDIYPYLWQHFDRIQLNFHGQWHKISRKFLEILPEFKGKQVIFQIDGINDAAWEGCRKLCDAVPFFDASHGAGVMPEKWPEPMDGVYNGYSGGLGPDNLAEEIPKIDLTARGAKFWIDMETKVRGGADQIFDMGMVRAALDTAAPCVTGYEKPPMYVCNKCGYCGPVALRHDKPGSHGIKCQYEACRVRTLGENDE